MAGFMAHDRKILDSLDSLQGQIEEIRSRIESLPSGRYFGPDSAPRSFLRRHRKLVILAAGAALLALCIALALYFLRKRD